MNDREICEKIVVDGGCLYFKPNLDCPQCHLDNCGRYCHAGNALKNAKQWLKDNQELPESK